MLSIALFSECYHPMRNGVVVSVSSFARQMATLGHHVTIFTARHPDQRGAEEGVYRFPSITFPTRARYPVAIPLATGQARRVLAQTPFDIVHSNAPMTMGQVALAYTRQRRLPLVFTYHTLIEEYTHYIPLPRPLVRGAAVGISRAYANAAHHVITPSAHVAVRLRDYGVHRPISVIPTGLDIDFIDSLPETPLRARFDIPADVPLLVYAGRLAREKNIPRILQAFRLALARRPDAHLLLIGGGPFDRGILALANALGITPRMRMTGFVDRATVMQGLRAADLFVFASLTETQGLVIGEAMACHTPVVAVASPAAGEIIDSGQEGLLVEATDVALAEGIIALLADPTLRAAMAVHARRRAESLSAALCTARLLDIYHQAVAEYRPGLQARA